MALHFFFQAEDGIRDYKVTGVQTCALPICLQMHGHIACVHIRLLGYSDVNLRNYYACLCVLQRLAAQYIPPMPPPPGIGGIFSFSFFSTTTHSVVRSSPAMDAAFCSAVRVTLVGSMTPAATRSSYSSVWAL